MNYIELGAGVSAGSVEGDHLMAQKVLAGRNTGGNSECDFSLVRNHTVHTPHLVGNVETIFPNLEPFETSHVSLKRIGNLRTVDEVKNSAQCIPLKKRLTGMT